MLKKDMKKSSFYAYFIWGVGSLFYLYEYFVRVIPSILNRTAESPLNASMSQIAAAASIYFLIYSPMQLLVGPLFDSFGGRKLFLLNSGILAVSCLLPLIPIEPLLFLGIGRFGMGFASAFGFVGIMYLCTTLFPPQRLAMLSGLTSTLGIVGAVTAQTSLSALSTTYTNVWLFALGFGLLVLFLLYCFIPHDKPTQIFESTWQAVRMRLWYLAKQKHTWLIGLLTGALFSPFAIFADLWGISYFTQICHFTQLEASQLVSILNISWAIAAPTIGWISDRLQSRKTPLVVSGIAATLLFTSLLWFPPKQFISIAILIAALGVSCGGQVVGFVACANLNPSHMGASSVSFTNMLCMTVCGLGQPIVGWIIDGVSSTHTLSESYRLGLSIIPIMLIITTACVARFFKEKAEFQGETTL